LYLFIYFKDITIGDLWSFSLSSLLWNWKAVVLFSATTVEV
jgi:hypothetical protein